MKREKKKARDRAGGRIAKGLRGQARTTRWLEKGQHSAGCKAVGGSGGYGMHSNDADVLARLTISVRCWVEDDSDV